MAGVDGKGNILWGKKITYALQLMPDPQASAFDYLNIDAGQLIRTETDSAGIATTTLVETNIPYQYSEEGVASWGFTVSKDGNALSLSLSRFADASVASGHNYVNVSDGSAISPKVKIVKSSGVYFLRNPQAVINLN